MRSEGDDGYWVGANSHAFVMCDRLGSGSSAVVMAARLLDSGSGVSAVVAAAFVEAAGVVAGGVARHILAKWLGLWHLPYYSRY